MAARGSWWALKAAILPIPVVVAFNDFIASVACVEGGSMKPTLNPDPANSRDRVLLNKLSPRIHDYQRGDVCMLRNPRKHEEWICKRLIAVEGDKIRTRGEELVTVPQGHGWFEGDDQDKSQDSNTFGSVPLALINGKVVYVIWPPSRIGKVDKTYPSDRVFQGYGRFGTH